MRPEFNPDSAGEPVSTYELGLSSAPIQIAFADNGIIAITDFERTVHLYDRQYHPLHTFTYCDDVEMVHDDFEHDSMPTQIVFDGHGNILLAVMLYSAERQGNVLRFNANGKRLPEISIPEEVQHNLAENDGSYYNVTGVTRDSHGNVFFRLIHSLSDGSISRVYLCKQSGSSGVPTVLNDEIYGEHDDEDVEEEVRHYVNQLACGPNGRLYAVCPGGIQEINTTSGDKVRTISLDALPIGDDAVSKACFSLTVSSDGYIFVVLLGTPDVHVFSQDGSYLNKLSTPCSDSAGATAIDRDGFLHVVDPGSGCVYVF